MIIDIFLLLATICTIIRFRVVKLLHYSGELHTEDVCSDGQRKVAFSKTALSFDTTSLANPDEYRHKTYMYISRNHRPWATSLPLTVYRHFHVF